MLHFKQSGHADLGFWSGNLFLIAPFPDLCLLVLFFEIIQGQICKFCKKTLFGGKHIFKALYMKKFKKPQAKNQKLLEA